MEEKKRTDRPTFSDGENITEHLRELGGGNREISEEAQLLLHAELRRLATAWMRRERKGGTLCTTVLVNEAYLRIFNRKDPQWNNREHFLADASRVMRRLLVDYARQRQARIPHDRRSGLDTCTLAVDALAVETLDIHRALEAMAAVSPRQAQLVELRFFGGCSLDEAAATLGISARTADKDWLLARAWLKNYLDSNR